jgi:hypothetical protein
LDGGGFEEGEDMPFEFKAGGTGTVPAGEKLQIQLMTFLSRLGWSASSPLERMRRNWRGCARIDLRNKYMTLRPKAAVPST